MTPDDFRRLALDFPEAEERRPHAPPGFPGRRKIFATLGYPEHGWAMVKLAPEQQHNFVEATRPSSYRRRARGAAAVRPPCA